MSSTYLAPALAADLPPKAKLALIAIGNNASPEGQVVIDLEYLATRLWRGATTADAEAALAALVKAGYLARAPELDDLFTRPGTGYQAFESIWEAGRIQA